jgi:hypothetical protein
MNYRASYRFYKNFTTCIVHSNPTLQTYYNHFSSARLSLPHSSCHRRTFDLDARARDGLAVCVEYHPNDLFYIPFFCIFPRFFDGYWILLAVYSLGIFLSAPTILYTFSLPPPCFTRSIYVAFLQSLPRLYSFTPICTRCRRLRCSLWCSQGTTLAGP